MNVFLTGLWLVVTLELRQRVRGRAWYVLLGCFIFLIAVVTALMFLAFGGLSHQAQTQGGGIFSTIIYFVLLLGTLVSPALSGTAINGDRDAGTLATTQVTLVTTTQLVLGKFVAAWLTALAFLAAAVPFLVFSVLWGQVPADTVAVSILVLALELGFVAAIGVGLSGLISKPLFSIVTTYLAVAAVSVGTLIGFGLAGLTVTSVVHTTYISVHQSADGNENLTPDDFTCEPPEVIDSTRPRFDYFWGILVANPYVIVADAAPTALSNGQPQDLFGYIKLLVRAAQVAPDLNPVDDQCAQLRGSSQFSDGTAQMDGPGPLGSTGPTSRELLETTTPGWFVGLAIQIVLGVAALGGALLRTRTPAGRLTKGSRVA